MSSIRCHTIPEFYLKYFLPNDSTLFWVYDKKDKESRAQPPINTTVIGDYYLSDPDDAGKKNDAVERLLSFIEGNAKNVLDRIIRKQSPIKKTEKEILAIFLAFTFSRAPRSVNVAKEMRRAGVERAFEIMKEEGQLEKIHKRFIENVKESSISLEEVKEIIDNPHKFVTIEINEKHAIGDSFGSTAYIHPYLMAMNWSIRIAKKDHFFVTSDAPVNVFLPVGENQVIFGAGFGKEQVEVMFPVNPRICLYLTKHPVPEIKSEGWHFVSEMNKRTICMAERFVISTFKSNKIASFIQKVGYLYGQDKLDKDYLRDRFRKNIKLKDEN